MYFRHFFSLICHWIIILVNTSTSRNPIEQKVSKRWKEHLLQRQLLAKKAATTTTTTQPPSSPSSPLQRAPQTPSKTSSLPQHVPYYTTPSRTQQNTSPTCESTPPTAATVARHQLRMKREEKNTNEHHTSQHNKHKASWSAPRSKRDAQVARRNYRRRRSEYIQKVFHGGASSSNRTTTTTSPTRSQTPPLPETKTNFKTRTNTSNTETDIHFQDLQNQATTPGTTTTPTTKRNKKQQWTPKDLQSRYRKLLAKQASNKSKYENQKIKKDNLKLKVMEKWKLLLPDLPHPNEGGRSRMDRSTVKKMEALCSLGVPSQMRPQVWPVCIGNALSITEDLFEIFRDRAKIARQQEENYRRRENDIRRKKQIEKNKEIEKMKNQEKNGEMNLNSPERNVKNLTTKTRHQRERSGTWSPTSNSDITKALDQSTITTNQTNNNNDNKFVLPSSPSNTNSKHQTKPNQTKTKSSLDVILPGGKLMGRENTINRIKVDLPRTFPQLAFFVEGSPLHQALRDVLEAYTFMRPDCGYVQGNVVYFVIFFISSIPLIIIVLF